MFPKIDKRETGIRLRKLMDQRGISARDVQEYLRLSCVQSVYHWLNGISMPTVDNLYALKVLFQVPIDTMLCGNVPEVVYRKCDDSVIRMQLYYKKLNEMRVA